MAVYGSGIACVRGDKGLDDYICWRWFGDGCVRYESSIASLS